MPSAVAEIHEIPDDEKVSAEAEPRDEVEFVIELCALRRAGMSRSARARRRASPCGERNPSSRPAARDTSEIRSRGFRSEKSRRSARRTVFVDRFGRVGERAAPCARAGLRCRSSLCASRRPAASRCVWFRAQVKTSSTARSSRCRVEHAIRREQRELCGGGEIAQRIVFALFAAAKVALDFHEDIFPAEDRRRVVRWSRARRLCRRVRARGAPGLLRRPSARRGRSQIPPVRPCARVREFSCRAVSRA